MERKNIVIEIDKCLNKEITPTTKDIVKALNESHFAFYLGGSRSMAKRAIQDDFCEVEINISPSTDFDFYVTDCPQVDSFLLSLGFKVKTYPGDKSYTDDEAISIYEIETTPKVQVVSRKDAEFYKKVFDNISLKFYYNHLWKSAPHFKIKHEIEYLKIKDTMNQLFAMARAFMPVEERGKVPEGLIKRSITDKFW